MPELTDDLNSAEPVQALATDADFALGRAALLEITSAESIGAPAGSIAEADGVLTVYFDTLLSGYPGWRWTVSIAHVEGDAPSVLETELTPGDDALLSPAWIPWVDRLADYRAAQDAAGEDVEVVDDEDAVEDDVLDDDALDDDTDEDEDEDDDDLGSDILHGGDLDGVDIDDLDVINEDDEDDEDIDDDDDDPLDGDADEDERERSF
jgi:hypothetical protein